MRYGRSRWPLGLRRGSAASGLLGLPVLIPTGPLTLVSCECCVLSGRGPCVGLITLPEETYRVCVSPSVIKGKNNLYTYNECVNRSPKVQLRKKERMS